MKIGRIDPASFHILIIPTIFEINHLNACGMRHIHCIFNILHHRLGFRHIKTSQIQIAPFGGIGILHVNYNQCGLLG